MSEDTNTIKSSPVSDDSSITIEKTDSSTPSDIPQSTMVESTSGGVSDTLTHTGTSPDDVEMVSIEFENSSSVETGQSIKKIKDNLSDDEPTRSIENRDHLKDAVPTLDLPKSVKKVEFCVPALPVPNPSESTDISPSTSTQSLQDITATLSGRLRKDILSMPDCLEGTNKRARKSCGTKAKKRSFAKASAHGNEPCSEMGSTPAKQSDLDKHRHTSEFQEKLLSDNPMLSSMLDPTPNVTEQSDSYTFQWFNLVKLMDENLPVGSVEVSSVAELSPPIAAFVDVHSIPGPSSAADFTGVTSVAGPSSAADFTGVTSVAGPSSAADFTEVTSISGLSSAADFTELLSLPGSSTSRSSQNSPLRDWTPVREYIEDKSRGLLEQVRELDNQREFWMNDFPSVPPCLEQNEEEPVVGSRSFLSFHEETGGLVDRLMIIITGLLEISNEVVAYLRSERDWQTLKFDERLTDYLHVFNSTNNNIGELQIVIDILRRRCINYEPCLFPVNVLENSTAGVTKCVIRIISIIAGILARIPRKY